jgi:ElaB/YqjD/DUF883 family membrane-anchored ribosome-binding protein
MASSFDSVTHPTGSPEIAETLDQARSSVASALDRAAESLRDLGGEGEAGEWTRAAAHKIGAAAGYLRTTDVRHMGAQAWDAVQSRPGTALILAASAGFLIGALLRRR